MVEKDTRKLPVITKECKWTQIKLQMYSNFIDFSV